MTLSLNITKINMEPKNWWFGNGSPFPTGEFSASSRSFSGGVSLSSSSQLFRHFFLHQQFIYHLEFKQKRLSSN